MPEPGRTSVCVMATPPQDAETVSVPDPGRRWRLEEICESPQVALALLEDVLAAAERLAADKGSFATISPARLAGVIDDYEALRELRENYEGYAHLSHLADMADQAAADTLAKATLLTQRIDDQLRWVELEWSALEPRVADALLADPQLAGRRHWLESQRRFAPFTLEEDAENALAAREEAASSGWERLHGRLVGQMRIPVLLPGSRRRRKVGFGQAIGMVRHPDPWTRRSMLEGMAGALEPHLDTLAACYDGRVADRLAVDRLRSHAHPMEATNLRNDLPDSLVDGLVGRVADAYPIARRWFAAKGAALGQAPLELADLYAPLGSGDLRIGWEDAVAQVVEAFDGFSADAGNLARRIIDGGHLDAEVRAGKRPGAFCAPIGSRVDPFVMLAFDDGMRQASTLAHELGHAVHNMMSARTHRILDYRTGTAMAEIPSTFFELVFRDLALERLPDEAARATLRCAMLEDTFAIVFRQVQMTRFERLAYEARGRGETLDAGRLGDLWLKTTREYFGETVDLPAYARNLWSYIPHFIVARFYTYAYSFAYLCALSLHARWRQDPEGMSERISTALLARGGAASPAAILADLGFDVDGTEIWDEGLAAISGEVDAARRDLALLA